MIFLITGRVGSGKQYLADKLSAKGLSLIKPYITMPEPKNKEIDFKTFIFTDKNANFDDKFTIKSVNNCETFFRKSQFAESDDMHICIIDPDDIETVCNALPNVTFRLIYVQAEDIERRFNSVKHAEDKIKAEQAFDAVDENEDVCYCAFEDKLFGSDRSNDWIPENLTCIYRYVNEYSENSAGNYTEFLISEKNTHDKLTKIVKESAGLDIVDTKNGDDNQIKVVKTNETVYVTAEHFADLLISDSTGFTNLMKTYITLSPRFSDIC